MADLPVMLKVRGWRVIVVGGGAVALRRAISLKQAGADVIVIAPRLEAGFDALGVKLERREYREGDLAGARIVVIATDSPQVNQQVAADAADVTGMVLINRADDPEAGDFAVPAHEQVGPVMVAVSTSGISARAAAEIRDQLLVHLDPAWVELLTIVAPFREQLQARVADTAARNEALRSLVDDGAKALLRREGADALRRHCEAIVARFGRMK